MPAHTPTGWRIVSQSTCRAMFASDLTHEQAGDAAGELDDLDAALDRARASASVLPCSRVTRVASSSSVPGAARESGT